MNEDQFFDRLRKDARSLRYEADAFMTTRITARVRERISAAPTVSILLARWLRPVAASLSVLALAGCISVAIVQERGLRIDAILGGMQPQIRREIDQANVEIERILTPEQKAKFDQMRMRMRSRLHRPEGSSPADSPDR